MKLKQEMIILALHKDWKQGESLHLALSTRLKKTCLPSYLYLYIFMGGLCAGLFPDQNSDLLESTTTTLVLNGFFGAEPG